MLHENHARLAPPCPAPSSAASDPHLLDVSQAVQRLSAEIPAQAHLSDDGKGGAAKQRETAPSLQTG